MHTPLIPASPATSTLRASKADFFKMPVFGASKQVPVRDCNPLRRSLNRESGVAALETNDNMCVALWELMARN